MTILTEEMRTFAANAGISPDDPLMLVLQGNAKLEAKVELWSKAISELSELARTQNTELRTASDNSNRLTEAMEQVTAGIKSLNQELVTLNQASSRLTPEAHSALATKMIQLDQALTETQSKIQRISPQVLQKWSAERISVMVVSGLLGTCLVVGMGWMIPTLQTTRTQVDQLAKIQNGRKVQDRMEKQRGL